VFYACVIPLRLLPHEGGPAVTVAAEALDSTDFVRASGAGTTVGGLRPVVSANGPVPYSLSPCGPELLDCGRSPPDVTGPRAEEAEAEAAGHTARGRPWKCWGDTAAAATAAAPAKNDLLAQLLATTVVEQLECREVCEEESTGRNATSAQPPRQHAPAKRPGNVVL
jgi:hypothetical protein